MTGPEEEQDSRSNAPQKQSTPEALGSPEGTDPKSNGPQKQCIQESLVRQCHVEVLLKAGELMVRQVAQQVYNSGKQAGQGRAGQGRAGQGRAGQGRAGQGRAPSGRGDGRPRTPVLVTDGEVVTHGAVGQISQRVPQGRQLPVQQCHHTIGCIGSIDSGCRSCSNATALTCS